MVPPRKRERLWLVLLTACLPTPTLRAHPVEEKVYDRTVTVRLTRAAVVVDYLLEINALTAYADVGNMVAEPQRARLLAAGAEEVYRAFLRETAPQLANGLVARLDGKELSFVCKQSRFQVLDHLRCEFRLEAAWQPALGNKHAFDLCDSNFEDRRGSLRLSLTTSGALTLLARTQPDEVLLKRPSLDLAPGDRERLRRVSATFEPSGGEETALAEDSTEESSDGPVRPQTLKDLLFHSRLGLWLLLGLAALFGGAHALTPGHGKTLVAAYLVGQRGTVGHAVLLGLVTTLTHTGAVLLVAAVLPSLFPGTAPQSLQAVLEFGGGLLIAGLGFWLLLRRLSGKADHIHLWGHHHHHHGDHDHSHAVPGEAVTVGSLVLLGISGGIVPCGEAIALFTLAVQWQRLDLAFPLLLAFSAGLAGVLVLIGIGVVYARRFSVERWGEGPRVRRVARALPVVSAILVTALGLGLCYHAVHQ